MEEEIAYRDGSVYCPAFQSPTLVPAFEKSPNYSFWKDPRAMILSFYSSKQQIGGYNPKKGRHFSSARPFSFLLYGRSDRTRMVQYFSFELCGRTNKMIVRTLAASKHSRYLCNPIPELLIRHQGAFLLQSQQQNKKGISTGLSRVQQAQVQILLVVRSLYSYERMRVRKSQDHAFTRIPLTVPLSFMNTIPSILVKKVFADPSSRLVPHHS